MTPSDVDLQALMDEFRCRQSAVSLQTHGSKRCFICLLPKMFVTLSLFRNRRTAAVVSISTGVVVSTEDTSIIGKGKQLLS